MMMYVVGKTPKRVIGIETLYLFQGNPQINNDQILNFWDSFKEQVQVSVPTKEKENKVTTKKQVQQPSCTSYLIKGARDMKEHKTRAQKKTA